MLGETNKNPTDFTEMPSDDKFASVTKPQKPIVLHIKVIDRQKKLISKSSLLLLKNCLLPPQEAPCNDHAIP